MILIGKEGPIDRPTYKVLMPVRAFIDSDSLKAIFANGSAMRVLMPVRAFIDSDKSCTACEYYVRMVLMPVRAFIDSDSNVKFDFTLKGQVVLMPVRAFIDSDWNGLGIISNSQESLNAREGFY